jgi:hypothetical protein
MARRIDPQARARAVWALADRQHGAVSRAQLLRLGYTPEAIDHRRAKGRLHVRARGVYAVGRPDLGRYGEMMVAVLASGPDAVISHETAAELWRLRRPSRGPLHVSLPRPGRSRRPGILAHRRTVWGRRR